MHFPHIPHYHFGLQPHIFHNLLSLALIAGLVYVCVRLFSSRKD